MTERVKGMTLQQAGAVRNTEIAKELSLPPVKVGPVQPSVLRFESLILSEIAGRSCIARC